MVKGVVGRFQRASAARGGRLYGNDAVCPLPSELLTRAIQEVESTELKLTELFHISPTYVVFPPFEPFRSHPINASPESLPRRGVRGNL